MTEQILQPAIGPRSSALRQVIFHGRLPARLGFASPVTFNHSIYGETCLQRPPYILLVCLLDLIQVAIGHLATWMSSGRQSMVQLCISSHQWIALLNKPQAIDCILKVVVIGRFHCDITVHYLWCHFVYECFLFAVYLCIAVPIPIVCIMHMIMFIENKSLNLMLITISCMWLNEIMTHKVK